MAGVIGYIGAGYWDSLWHRRRTGTLCGQPLDPWGKHALKCEVGPTREARHDSMRDFTAVFHPRVSGYVACKEQRVVA